MTKVRSVNPARIYQARLAAGMTQDDLAHRIRVLSSDRIRTTASRLSRWENGTNSPHAEAVPVIAAATKVTLDYLYGSDDDEEESEAVDIQAVLHEAAAVFAKLGSAFGQQVTA